MIIPEFSKFVTNLKFNDIPKVSIEKAKLCFLDYLSVYKRGLYEENSKIAIKTLLDLGYLKTDDILNKGLINGIVSHSLDLDDGHRLAFLHPGVIIFSTALAILQDEKIKECSNISVETFFESVVASYEIAIVLGMLVNPNHRNQGFHSTGTIGSIISSVTASKLLNFSLEETINALALATTQSAGFLESDHSGSMAKTLHVGKAVYNGLLSTFLAKNGFTGAESIIEGNEGFLKSMVSSRNFDNVDFNVFLEDNLGKFHINKVYLKKYPFCRHIHSSIDAILNLRRDLLKYGDADFVFNLINKIQIKTYKIASEHDDYSPKTKAALKQSLPYAIAIYLVCGDLSLDLIDELIDEGLLSEDSEFTLKENMDLNNKVFLIKSIAKNVLINLDTELEDLTPEKRPSKISINLNKDYALGFDFEETIENLVLYPLGECENPLLWDDIINKFSNLNPNFNLSKLEVLKTMENKSIYEVLDFLKNDN